MGLLGVEGLLCDERLCSSTGTSRVPECFSEGVAGEEAFFIGWRLP